MTTTSSPRRLAFLLDAQVEDAVRSIDQAAHLSLTARIVELNDDGNVRNILESDDAGLADLVVQARAAADMGPGTYGWAVEYLQPYAVDLPRAQAMARTLAKLQRGMGRLDERLGHPESFGAYLLRVAEVLRVRDFCSWNKRPRSLMYEGALLNWSGSVAAYWLAEQERDFHKQHSGEAGA
jgi:hypothetical protein